MSKIEFGIAPLRGYRKWDVRDGRLVSHCHNQVWPPRAPARAVCQACSRAGRPVPSDNKYGHFAGGGCGLYAWSAPELLERNYRLPSKRIECWGVVEGWGRTVEHERGFRALYLRPLAVAPLFPVDLSMLADLAALYDIPLLTSTDDVRRAFPPLTTGALP